MKTKYIVTSDGPGGLETMFIFPEHIVHKHMADGARVARGGRPVSAGFLSITTDKKDRPRVAAFGESESLGIKSRPEEDTALAADTLGIFRR